MSIFDKIELTKEDKKNNRKVNLIIIGVVSVLIISFILFNVFNNTKQEENVDIANNSLGLPIISEVDYDKSPIMYDFLNGSAGYYSYPEINQGDYEKNFVIIARETNNPENIFISSYQGITTPRVYPMMGFKPFATNQNLEENIKWLDENSDQILKENTNNIDYTFYVLTDYSDIPKMGGFKFGYFQMEDWYDHLEYSNIMKNIENGFGYETAFLRNYDFLIQNIKDYQGIDLNNSFWDNFNWKSCIYLPLREDVSEYVDFDGKQVPSGMTPLYLVPVKENTFQILNNGLEYEYKVDDPENDIEVYIQSRGCESIDWALKNGSYRNEKDFWNGEN